MSRDTVNSITISACITSGITPKPRAGHATCIVSEKIMAVFGGTSGADHLNDLHFLDSETLEWQKAEPSNDKIPPPRSRHAMEWCKETDSIYLFGGADDKKDFGGLWVFQIASKTWSNPSTSGPAPCARWGLSACTIKTKIYVYGGSQTNGVPDEQATMGVLFCLDVVTLTWEIVKTSGQGPPPRAGHTCNVFGDRYLCLFGGGDGCQLFNDIYVFDTVACEWIPLPIPSISNMVPLHARWAHTAIAWDGQLIVYGGANGPLAYGEVVSISIDVMMARLMVERFGGSVDASVASPFAHVPGAPEDEPLLGRRGSAGMVNRGKSDAIYVWLRSLGVEEYASAFVNQGITMRMVMFLTEDHLEELGVDVISARLAIMSGIHQLKLMNTPMQSNPIENAGTLTVAISELAKVVQKLQEKVD